MATSKILQHEIDQTSTKLDSQEKHNIKYLVIALAHNM